MDACIRSRGAKHETAIDGIDPHFRGSDLGTDDERREE
jgi:hypothetical protein